MTGSRKRTAEVRTRGCGFWQQPCGSSASDLVQVAGRIRWAARFSGVVEFLLELMLRLRRLFAGVPFLSCMCVCLVSAVSLFWWVYLCCTHDFLGVVVRVFGYRNVLF